MDKIEELIELSKKIHDIYINISEKEINNEDTKNLESLVLYLSDKENQIMKSFFDNNKQLIKFENYLQEKTNKEESYTDTIIKNNTDYLVKLRLNNKWFQMQINLTDKQVEREYDINYIKINNYANKNNLFFYKWTLLRLVTNEISKNQYKELINYSDKFDLDIEDKNNIISYTNMLVYTFSDLEPIHFGKQKLNTSKSKFIYRIDKLTTEQKIIYNQEFLELMTDLINYELDYFLNESSKDADNLSLATHYACLNAYIEVLDKRNANIVNNQILSIIKNCMKKDNFQEYLKPAKFIISMLEEKNLPKEKSLSINR